MSAELIILAGAILGAFAVFLVFQLRKLLVEKQIPFNDIDAVVKALFEIELNREFFLKLAIGTGIGAVGAFLSLGGLVAGAPVDSDVSGLIIYGFAWGFAGNGILRVFTMIPEIFTVLNITKENVQLNQQNNDLRAQNNTLLQLNSSLGQNAANTEETQPPFPLGRTTEEKGVITEVNKNQPVERSQVNPNDVPVNQVTPLTAARNEDGTKTV
jgi:hypothetical protein